MTLEGDMTPEERRRRREREKAEDREYRDHVRSSKRKPYLIPVIVGGAILGVVIAVVYWAVTGQFG